jgi:hypothetical protein
MPRFHCLFILSIKKLNKINIYHLSIVIITKKMYQYISDCIKSEATDKKIQFRSYYKNEKTRKILLESKINYTKIELMLLLKSLIFFPNVLTNIISEYSYKTEIQIYKRININSNYFHNKNLLLLDDIIVTCENNKILLYDSITLRNFYYIKIEGVEEYDDLYLCSSDNVNVIYLFCHKNEDYSKLYHINLRERIITFNKILNKDTCKRIFTMKVLGNYLLTVSEHHFHFSIHDEPFIGITISKYDLYNNCVVDKIFINTHFTDILHKNVLFINDNIHIIICGSIPNDRTQNYTFNYSEYDTKTLLKKRDMYFILKDLNVTIHSCNAIMYITLINHNNNIQLHIYSDNKWRIDQIKRPTSKYHKLHIYDIETKKLINKIQVNIKDSTEYWSGNLLIPYLWKSNSDFSLYTVKKYGFTYLNVAEPVAV